MEAASALCSLSSPPALTHFPFSNHSSSKPYYPTIPSLVRPFSSSISASTPSSATTSPPSSNKISVLIHIGFGTEEMEAVVMIDVLRRAGAEVTVASVEPQLQVEASGVVRIVTDNCISKCRNEVFDLVALPTTYHPAFHGKLPTFWAVESNIQVSRELTTSRGTGNSFEFVLSLVEELYGGTVAGEVGELLLISTADGQAKVELNKVEWTFYHSPRVLVSIANGSGAIEVVTIADVLRRAKMDVVLASVGKSRQILASRDTRIIADKLIFYAAEATYDLIILPVGRKSRYQESLQIQNLEKAAERAKLIRKDMWSNSPFSNRLSQKWSTKGEQS